MPDPFLALPLLDATALVPIDRPFLARDALAEGVSPHRLRTWTDAGLVRRVLKGVYVAAQVPDDVVMRARALGLVVPREAVATDWTAHWFWTGWSKAGDPTVVPPLSVFHTIAHRRLRNDLTLSGARHLRPSEIASIGDLRVTTPLRTALDLGRLSHRDAAIGALDALLRHGTFTHEELLAEVDRFKGMRGVVQLRALAPVADARAESPPESTLRLRWLDLPSLPRPEPQISITVDGIEVHRLDLGVRELRYACEYDGAEFHLDEEVDRDRRQDLLDRFWWDVDGVRRHHVFGPTRDIERILYEGIERARRTIGRRSSYFV